MEEVSNSIIKDNIVEGTKICSMVASALYKIKTIEYDINNIDLLLENLNNLKTSVNVAEFNCDNVCKIVKRLCPKIENAISDIKDAEQMISKAQSEALLIKQNYSNLINGIAITLVISNFVLILNLLTDIYYKNKNIQRYTNQINNIKTKFNDIKNENNNFDINDLFDLILDIDDLLLELQDDIKKLNDKSWYYGFIGALGLSFGLLTETTLPILKTCSILFGSINLIGSFWYKLTEEEYKQLYKDTIELRKEIRNCHKKMSRKTNNSNNNNNNKDENKNVEIKIN